MKYETWLGKRESNALAREAWEFQEKRVAHLISINATLRQRPDLPVDRIPEHAKLTQRILELEKLCGLK